MMQAADPGECDDLAELGRLDAAVTRRVLAQGQVTRSWCRRGQDLSREGRTRANAGDPGAEEEPDQAEHPERMPEEGGSGNAGARGAPV